MSTNGCKYVYTFVQTQIHTYIHAYINTVHGKILAWEKLTILANYELFSKIFLTDTPEILAYALTVGFSPNFSSQSFYLYGLPKFPLPKFSCVQYMAYYLYVNMHAFNYIVND